MASSASEAEDSTNDNTPAAAMVDSNATESSSDGSPANDGAAVATKVGDDDHEMGADASAADASGRKQSEDEPAQTMDQPENDADEDAALARMMAFQEEQDGHHHHHASSHRHGDDAAVPGDGNLDNINNMDMDPNVAFLGDEDADDDEEDALLHPNLNNPAAIALRQRQALQNAARLNPNAAANTPFANQPYPIRKLLTLLQPTLRYTPLSLLAATLLLHHTLRTRQQFYLALVYLQSSKLAYILLGNAVIALAVSSFGFITRLFLDGGLRPNERDAIGEHIRWDVTETCLALTIFRSELDVVTAIMFLGLVILKWYVYMITFCVCVFKRRCALLYVQCCIKLVLITIFVC